MNILEKIEEIPKDRSFFIFDLDGTLVESKTNVDSEMASLLNKLLAKNRVAVIGGGTLEQIRSQLADNLSADASILDNLLLLPLDGGSFYVYKDGDWNKVYSQDLTNNEKKMIFDAFEKAFKDVSYIQPTKIYGELIEDRGSQITFSALGQDAPLDEKNNWNKENDGQRFKITERLRDYLPGMDARVAGVTSIDVTKKGINKKFGVEQVLEYLKIAPSEAVFFGDSLDIGGNDHPVTQSDVPCFKVNSVFDTKKALEFILA